tara:strand:- start:2769 stop:2981 length:213 start_codon:yes stop_codon:yes gene_type:complete
MSLSLQKIKDVFVLEEIVKNEAKGKTEEIDNIIQSVFEDLTVDETRIIIKFHLECLRDRIISKIYSEKGF